MKHALLGGVLLALASGAAAAKAGYLQEPSTPKSIEVTARKFEFEPKRIEVKVGQIVTLQLNSFDAEHGFECKDLGIKGVTYQKGKPASVTFTAAKAGTYEFKCSHRCGSGHGDMKGQIVVAP